MRCAIYTRRSSSESPGREITSLDTQRFSCESYIASQAANNWTALPERYDDGGFSGGSLTRPALSRLLADIEARRIDIVVVYKIDRLSRSLNDFVRLVDIFDRRDVTFISVTQNFSTTSSMGRLTLNVLLSFAQFEREMTSERLKDWFAGARARGIWSNHRPLGYRKEGGRLVIDPKEAGLVEFIFRKYISMGSTKDLVNHLNDKGIRTQNDAKFSQRSVNCIIHNKLYLGYMTYRNEILQVRHEPIVSSRLFSEAQHTAQRRRRGRRHFGLLTGLLQTENGEPCSYILSTSRGYNYRYYIVQLGAGICVRIKAIEIEWYIFDAVGLSKERISAMDAVSSTKFINDRVINVIIYKDKMIIHLKNGSTIESNIVGLAKKKCAKYDFSNRPTWFDSAEELVSSGICWNSVAKQLDVHSGTFYRIMTKLAPEAAAARKARVRARWASPAALERRISVDLKRAAALLSDGLSVNQTARLVGCDAKSLRRHQAKGRLPPSRFRVEPKAPIDLNKARQMLLEGFSEIRVANEFGRSTSTIQRLKKSGRLPTTRTWKRHVDTGLLAEMIASGESKETIARQFDISLSAVEYHISGMKQASLITTSKRINLELAQKILSSGAAIREAAAQLGVAVSTISYHIQRGRLSPRARLTGKVDVGKARELLSSGMSVSEIAKRMRVSSASIAYYQKDGRLPKSIYKRSKLSIDDIRNLITNNRSVRYIAGIAGVSVSSIYQLLQRDRRKRPEPEAVIN